MKNCGESLPMCLWSVKPWEVLQLFSLDLWQHFPSPESIQLDDWTYGKLVFQQTDFTWVHWKINWRLGGMTTDILILGRLLGNQPRFEASLASIGSSLCLCAFFWLPFLLYLLLCLTLFLKLYLFMCLALSMLLACLLLFLHLSPSLSVAIFYLSLLEVWEWLYRTKAPKVWEGLDCA